MEYVILLMESVAVNMGLKEKIVHKKIIKNVQLVETMVLVTKFMENVCVSQDIREQIVRNVQISQALNNANIGHNQDIVQEYIMIIWCKNVKLLVVPSQLKGLVSVLSKKLIALQKDVQQIHNVIKHLNNVSVNKDLLA